MSHVELWNFSVLKALFFCSCYWQCNTSRPLSCLVWVSRTDVTAVTLQLWSCNLPQVGCQDALQEALPAHEPAVHGQVSQRLSPGAYCDCSSSVLFPCFISLKVTTHPLSGWYEKNEGINIYSEYARCLAVDLMA